MRRRSGNLISDVLPCCRLGKARTQFDYAKYRSRSGRAVIRVYDEAGDVTEQTGEFARRAEQYARVLPRA